MTGQSFSSTRSRFLSIHAIALVLTLVVAMSMTMAITVDKPASAATYEVAKFDVPRGNGFGGATISYPKGITGQVGAAAISPGFTENRSALAWLAQVLAEQGFAVINIDTNSLFDSPGSRGDQLLAALKYLTGSSQIKNMVNPDKLAVLGHSMGGGGSLDAAKKFPSLKATVPLAPYNNGANYSSVKVPSLIIAGQSDRIAPVGVHARPFYQQQAGPKAYLEFAGGSHFTPISPNEITRIYTVAWLKRFVNGDTSVDSLLCPAPTDNRLSASLVSCPLP